ncbi:response regulator [Fibrivirga algicola]|uniref:Response regulator n=1 Tax=Fibrivirga algicola TaxID=2950420 RepID=A0ABX0QCJ3_9BACT|nr:response regulator [Fibrivirga algicola]NID08961.1 response regulator [Fibrivirga algicola]
MSQPVRILLVEDDEDDITFFELALKKQSIDTQLTTLTDGDQVMPYLNETDEHPDLLVLDLNLPKLPGRDVLTQVKKSPVSQDIPVVILSTSSAQEDNDFCLANGADRFLTKPTSLTSLSTMLAEVLDVTVK